MKVVILAGRLGIRVSEESFLSRFYQIFVVYFQQIILFLNNEKHS